jgi:hypothetical protein
MIPTMQQVEERLIEIGVKHAPIQGFSEGLGVDQRYVKLTDPPGTYYLLGIDLPSIGRNDPQYNQIQITFLGIKECAEGIATTVGWRIAEMRPLESVNGPIPSAILEAPAA